MSSIPWQEFCSSVWSKSKRAVLFFLSYLGWILIVRLLALSLLTFFLSRGLTPATFAELNENFTSNQLTFMGLASVVYLILIFSLNPIIQTNPHDFLAWTRIKFLFLPGLLHGGFLMTGFILLLILSGQYGYHGSPLQAGEVSLTLSTVVIRALMLISLVYCEEYIFRFQIMNSLKEYFGPIRAAFISTVLFCSLKLLQFEVGVLHLFSLFLLSTCLSLRSAIDRDFSRGAGFLAAILIVNQPVFGLPVLGTEFSGLFLIQPANTSNIIRWMTGGRGGPLSSLFFQFLIMIDIGRSYSKFKKNKNQKLKLSLVKDR